MCGRPAPRQQAGWPLLLHSPRLLLSRSAGSFSAMPFSSRRFLLAPSAVHRKDRPGASCTDSGRRVPAPATRPDDRPTLPGSCRPNYSGWGIALPGTIPAISVMGMIFRTLGLEYRAVLCQGVQFKKKLRVFVDIQTGLLGGADKSHGLHGAGTFADMSFRQSADCGERRDRKRQDDDHCSDPARI